MNNIVRIVSIFLLGLLVTSSFGIEDKTIKRFDVRYGFRTRQFDQRTVKWISYWVWMDKKDLKNLKEVQVLKNGKHWYTRKDLKKIIWPINGQRRLLFWQHGLAKQAEAKSRIEVALVMKDGGIHTCFYKKLETVSGTVFIDAFKNGNRQIKSSVVKLRFNPLDKGFMYRFGIYGPDQKGRLFRDLKKNTVSVDLSGYPAGKYLFCISKASRENAYNFISREYDVRIEKK